MSMQLGLTDRHLYEDVQQMGDPKQIVQDNIQAKKDIVNDTERHLTDTTVLSKLNWCGTENPLGRSVCTPVKSQRSCGSCWAFAATDVIETAVAIASKNDPQALSPQQFITCSTSTYSQRYSYCFVKDGQSSATSWLPPTVQRWDAQNTGCNGGMTHIALMDAAQSHYNLVTEVTWPYAEAISDTGIKSSIFSNPVTAAPPTTECKTFPANKTAASITGWEEAYNATSCTDTTDTNLLLKRALQTGPLAVALNAMGSFKSYTGGIYICPAITSSNMIDHAILLVGYDTDDTQGDYWILKNSYGSVWGKQGYLYLKADKVINCGLNIFPIRVLGASNGPASNVTIDGGGTLDFGGISMKAWLGFAIVGCLATIVLTIFGVIVYRRRVAAFRADNPVNRLDRAKTIVTNREDSIIF